MRVFRSRLFAVCVASLVTAMVVGGIAWAQIPGPLGVITGCYNNKTGALRVIDTSKTTCVAKTETQLTWNQQGVAGAPGAPGASGVVSAQDIHGAFVGGVPVTGFQWFGPFGDPSVTVAAGQKIVVTMSLSNLASSGGAVFQAQICDNSGPGATPADCTGVDGGHSLTATPTGLTLSGVIENPAVGTYKVGFEFLNGAGSLDPTFSGVDGSVMVVNSP